MNRSALWIAAFVFPALAGCAALDRDANADAIARPAGLRRMVMKTEPFVLTTFARIRDPGQPVTVYIEGDGLAWLSRTEVSRDPTPKEALGLLLAAADPSPNVAYLARPCQFTPRDRNPVCDFPYWTGKRFAPEVVRSVGEAIGLIAAQTPGQKVHLVGYSGGGAVAVLVAAERDDVASIRTVAGNLDHAEVNRLGRVSPLSGSLNPIDAAARVAHIPQIHFAGSSDTVVPPAIAERFRRASGSPCVSIRIVAGNTHEDGWRLRWPALLGESPACR